MTPERAEAGARAADHAWQKVRAMNDIQFAPVAPDPVRVSEPPAWLKALAKFFADLLAPLGRWLGHSFGVIETLLIALGILGALWLAWSLLWPLWRDRQPQAAAMPERGWAPERQAALALLEDADRLAAEGRFGEATHLLLLRSVDHIAAARPEWLRPSSTAREIGAIRELPWGAKRAFGQIAQEVERSLYALRGLTADDWARAREAYAEFALADLKGLPA